MADISEGPWIQGHGAYHGKRRPNIRSARLPLGALLSARCAGSDMAQMRGGFGCPQEGHSTWGVFGGDLKALVKHMKTE